MPVTPSVQRFTSMETAMVPGRSVILLVPSIAYDEAKEFLASRGVAVRPPAPRPGKDAA